MGAPASNEYFVSIDGLLMLPLPKIPMIASFGWICDDCEGDMSPKRLVIRAERGERAM